MKKLKQIWEYMKWLESERIKSAIHSGSAGPLM